MKPFGFLRKEVLEILKTPKWIVLTAVFIVFGIMSPIAAKYMNELIAGIGGLELNLPEPTYIDAYIQFFKNMYGLSIFVVIMTFMSMVVEEKVRGTALLVLTKGLSRTSFLLCKFFAASFFFSVVYALSMGVFLYYTFLLFPDHSMQNVGGSLFLFWLYGVCLIASTLLCSTLSKSHTIAAVSSFAFFMILSLSHLIPRIGHYLPGSYQTMGVEIMTGVKGVASLVVPISFAVVFISVTLFVAVLLFRQQEL
ncbi:MAG: ABC transporter permease [Caldisericia bacterium]|nr:ABC transporter permease [Caldisericia bacterium]